MVPIQIPGTLTLPARSGMPSNPPEATPLSTGQLVKEIYGWQLRVERKPSKSWHYQNVRRALRKVATPIGRASTRGRSVLWQPELLDTDRAPVGRTVSASARVYLLLE